MIRVFLFFVMCFMSSGLLAQADSKAFCNNLVSISVSNIEQSVNWYTQKLQFEVEEAVKDYPDYNLKIAFLKQGEFRLELIEMKNSIKQSEALKENQEYVGGIFKLGFKVDNIEAKYNYLQQMSDVNFVTEIGELPENTLSISWPTKYFLIKDPDENFIQFFDTGKSGKINPWLTMIIVENLEKSIKWYSNNLGYKHITTVGEKGNRRAILENNNRVIELYEPNSIKKAKDIPSDTNVRGFSKIAFFVKDIEAYNKTFKSNSVEVAYSITDSNTDWASKYMIVKDLDGNWIQIFE